MRIINYKFLLFLVVAGFIFNNQLAAEGTAEQGAAVSSLRKAPYLIYPGTNSEYTIMWQLKDTQKSLLKWGSDTTYSIGTIESEEYGDDHQHKYTFTGLTPGDKYYYSVKIDSKEYRGDFKAAPSDDSQSVKFIAYGDTRSQPSNHDKVAAQILNLFDSDPEYQGITAFVGDAVKRGSLEDDWDEQFFDPQYENMQKLRGSIGYQFAVGNHEDVDDSDIFAKYFTYPYEDDYYWAFDYGPVHFMMLDQYKASYSAGSPQIIWLEDELKKTDKKWKIIVLHKTGWSVGHHGSDETTQNVIQPLCEKYGVRLLLGGHNHLYARAYENGVYHITTGGGGASVAVEGDTTEEHLQKVVYKHHFCKINIIDDSLNCKVIDDSGSKIDEFSIKLGDYQLIANVNGSGSVKLSPSGGSYEEGTEVTVAAIANDGWEFANWSGDASGSDTTLLITMDDNKNITANFKSTSSLLIYDGAHATTIQGIIGTKNAGYTGDGYANTDNRNGTYIEWNSVNISDGGTYDCTIRYANGADNARGGDLLVNGSKAVSFIGASTGDFAVWETETVSIELGSGTNTIRLTGTTDESLGNIDKIELELTGSSSGSLDVQVSSGSDDAEQHEDGSVDFGSSDLELVEDGSRGKQIVGMRFNDIQIPQGAEITEAYIQFTADEVSEGACSLTIKGEAADNALTFLEENNNISDRQTTSAAVSWSPEDWSVKQEAGSRQKTPDIKTVIQEIVDRSAWNSGNSLAIIVSGSGRRTAESYNGSADEAAMLHIEYSTATVISRNMSETVPCEYSLSNYPNPFNPTTVIRYDIPKSGFAAVKVYNILGQEVASLLNEYKKSGKYQIEFDASHLPSGVYIYSIQSNGYIGFDKMVLLK